MDALKFEVAQTGKKLVGILGRLFFEREERCIFHAFGVEFWRVTDVLVTARKGEGFEPWRAVGHEGRVNMMECNKHGRPYIGKDLKGSPPLYVR